MNEYVIFQGAAAPRAYRGVFLLLLLGTILTLGLGLIISLPFSIWIWVEMKTKRYRITSERIEIQTRLPRPSSQVVELSQTRGLEFQGRKFRSLSDSCVITVETQDERTPNLYLKCFTHDHGRSVFHRLQFAVSEVKKNHKVAMGRR